MNLAGRFGGNDFGFTGGNVQQNHGLHLLASRLQLDGVIVGT